VQWLTLSFTFTTHVNKWQYFQQGLFRKISKHNNATTYRLKRFVITSWDVQLFLYSPFMAVTFTNGSLLRRCVDLTIGAVASFCLTSHVLVMLYLQISTVEINKLACNTFTLIRLEEGSWNSSRRTVLTLGSLHALCCKLKTEKHSDIWSRKIPGLLKYSSVETTLQISIE